MPKALLAVLCDDVREEMRGKVSLMGIFGQFMVSDFSKPLPRFRLYAKIGFDSDGNHSFTIRLRGADGQTIFEFNGVANVREEDSITRMFTANFNIGFDDLKLPGPGTYEIVFLHQEQEFHTVPLVAIRVTPPTLQ